MARIPAVVVSGSEASNPGVLKLAVSGGSGSDPLRIEMTDQGGEARLYRNLTRRRARARRLRRAGRDRGADRRPVPPRSRLRGADDVAGATARARRQPVTGSAAGGQRRVAVRSVRGRVLARRDRPTRAISSSASAWDSSGGCRPPLRGDVHRRHVEVADRPRRVAGPPRRCAACRSVSVSGCQYWPAPANWSPACALAWIGYLARRVPQPLGVADSDRRQLPRRAGAVLPRQRAAPPLRPHRRLGRERERAMTWVKNRGAAK